MTTKNDHLHSIQARIEELQNTISEKEEQIKKRASRLKNDLEAELSPMNIVRKYPFNAAGATFIAGLLLTKALKGNSTNSAAFQQTISTPTNLQPSQHKSAWSTIGLEALRSAKDLGFTYLQRYIDKKFK
ncbi:MAG: hypothetical protein FDX18_08205 [Chlorobium sp.]|nr:MAG: hypothetical protein FDX18_08205 [Chlorobium sp.]